MQISVRDVDATLFREFKACAVREGKTVGNLLALAMKRIVDAERKPSFLRMKSFDWGKGTETTSNEIDDVLY